MPPGQEVQYFDSITGGNIPGGFSPDGAGNFSNMSGDLGQRITPGGNYEYQIGAPYANAASRFGLNSGDWIGMNDPRRTSIIPDMPQAGLREWLGNVALVAAPALAGAGAAAFSGAGAAGAEAGAGAGSGVWGGAINSANAAGFGAGGAGAGIWGNAIQGANDAGFGGAGLFSGADNFDLMGDVGSLGGSGFNVSPSSLFSGGDPVMGGGGFNMSTANFMPGEVAGNPTLELLKRLGLGGSSPLSTGMNIFSGLYGMKQANDTQRFARGIYERQNAFDPYRPQAAQDLMSFMSNPNLAGIPGYNAGVQLTKRELAKQGYRGSGNMAVALNKFSGDFYNQEWARRASMAGVNAPSAGGAAISGSLGGADLASRALASLGYAGRGLEQLLKGVA